MAELSHTQHPSNKDSNETSVEVSSAESAQVAPSENQSEHRAQPENTVQQESGGKSPTKLRRAIAIGTSLGGLVVGGLTYNFIDAQLADANSHSATDYRGQKLTVSTFGLDPQLHLLLEKFPAALEQQIRVIARTDPELGKQIGTASEVQILGPEYWNRPSEVEIIRSGTTIQINAEYLRAVLQHFASPTSDISVSDRASILAVGIVSKIAGLAHMEQSQKALDARGLPRSLLCSSEFVGAALAVEEATRVLVTEDLSPHARENVTLGVSAPIRWVPAWQVRDRYCRTAHFINEALSAHWNLPQCLEHFSNTSQRIEDKRGYITSYTQRALDARLSLSASSPELALSADLIPAVQIVARQRMMAADAFVSRAQLRTLPTRIHQIDRLHEGKEIPRDSVFRNDHILGTNLGGPSLRSAKLLALSANGVLTPEELSTNSADDLLRISIKDLVQQIHRGIDRSSNEPRLSTLLNPTALFYAAESIIEGCKVLPREDVLRIEIEKSLEEGLLLLADSGLRSLEQDDKIDKFTIEWTILPTICASLEMLRAWRGVESIYSFEDRLSAWEHHVHQRDRITVKERLIKEHQLPSALVAECTDTQRHWLERLITDAIRYPTDTYSWDRFVPPGPEEYKALLQSPEFSRLDLQAQTAVVKELLGNFHGTSRAQIVTADPLSTFQVFHWNLLPEYQLLMDLSQKLTPEEGSLLVRAYCSIPTMERRAIPRLSGTEYSSGEFLTLYLLGDPQSAPGPLMKAMFEIKERDSRYQQVDPIAIASHGSLYWNPNVTFLGASRFDQLSWSTNYSNRVREYLSPSITPMDAHILAAGEIESKRIYISRGARWIGAGVNSLLDWELQGPRVEAGVFKQNPLTHSAISLTPSTPTHALILYGKNKLSDGLMRFDWDAGNWKNELERHYKSTVISASPGSKKELELTCEALASQIDQNSHIVVIVIAHGGTNALSKTLLGNEIPVSGVQLGFAELGGEFSLDELVFKKLVNEKFAQKAATVTVIVDTCHSGAME